MMHHFYLIVHLLGASIWVGGHLLLLFRYLPEALKTKNPEVISQFEKKFEPIGLPALLIQIVTGIIMAYNYNVGFKKWFQFENGIETIISIKLLLLFATLLLAVHARIFIIPKLSSTNLNQLAWHILAINIIAMALLVFGTMVQYGGL
jgi:putative copper export protein